jgi:hypothetical protein
MGDTGAHNMTGHTTNLTDRSGLSTQLVIAHYDEDLRWLRGHKLSQCFIYTKGTNPALTGIDSIQIRLPNVGRETHTYLYHIVSNFDRLADITIFCQAGVKHHVGNVPIDSLVRKAMDAHERGIVGFGRQKNWQRWEGIRYSGQFLQDINSGHIQRSRMSPAEFYRWTFGEEPPPYIPFHSGATLGVHRNAILARQKSFYERLLDYFETLRHSNPEEGHYMERFWVSAFDPHWMKRKGNYE